MSLLMMDSFDKYATDGTEDELLHFWQTVTADVRCTTGGRHTNELEIETGGFLVSKTVSPSGTTGIAGFAFKTDALRTDHFFEVKQGATIHVSLVLQSSGLIAIDRGVGQEQLALSSTPIAAGAWHYIELKWTIHDTTGAVELRIDGVSVASATNVDTRNASGSVAWDSIAFVGFSASVDVHFDDFYLLDDASSGVTGALNNDFLGDMVVEFILPDGNGTTSQLTGQDADSTDNFQNVDESPGPDEDTTYNESNTVGQYDSYAMADLGTIVVDDLKAIQAVAVVRKVDAGSRGMRSVIRHGGTDFFGTGLTLSTAYTGLVQIEQGANPGGGTSQWTIANVNAIEVGVEISS